MGRKKISENVGDEVHGMELVAQKQEEVELSIQRAEELYGDGEPYERLRLESEVRFYMEQMGTSLIEIGKRLIRMKAQEGHGGFMQCLENLGMSTRSANYAMSAARKFGSNSPTLANLGTSKIKCLTVLDDSQVEDLVNGDGVLGLGTLDDIEKMSVRELRAALRKEKSERKTERDDLEAVIAAKNSKVDELERELRHQVPPTKEQLAQIELDRIKKELFLPILTATEQFRLAQAAIAKARQIDGVTTEQLEAWVVQYNEQLSILYDEYEQTQDDIQNICPDKSEELECMQNGLNR